MFTEIIFLLTPDPAHLVSLTQVSHNTAGVSLDQGSALTGRSVNTNTMSRQINKTRTVQQAGCCFVPCMRRYSSWFTLNLNCVEQIEQISHLQ